MELKDLVGLHKLSGVDNLSESIKGTWGDGFEDCQVLRFVLDGVTYSVIEDPEDGYRSSMRDIKISEEPIKNTFEPQEVLCKYIGDDHGDDIIEITDVKSGKVILRAGTDDADDYYPMFLAEWTPENMEINKEI
jgi:hypothetical protein